jgi:hypothetical protein
MLPFVADRTACTGGQNSLFPLPKRCRTLLDEGIEAGNHIEEFLIDRALAQAVKGPVQIL